jgi:hypothetical protein
MLGMQRKDEHLVHAVGGAAQAMAGAYVGSVLFFVMLGVTDSLFHLQGTEALWTRKGLFELLSISLAGILMLSWWIVPAGVFVRVFFFPRVPIWPRKAAVIRGILLGAMLGLITAVCFTWVSWGSTPRNTIQASFAFLPLYCAVWCAGYSWLKAKPRTPSATGQ